MHLPKLAFGDVVAARTSLSLIDGKAGRLFFRGHNIREMGGQLKFENVTHLLVHGYLPSQQEEADFSRGFASVRRLSTIAESILRSMPPNARPIDVLKCVLAADGAVCDTSRPEIEALLACIAQAPTIVAAFHRLRLGFNPVLPDVELRHAENFLYMLHASRPDTDAANALNTYMAIMAEHGLNASTLNVRVIASTGAGCYQAIIGAISALEGPLHGGAAAIVLAQIEQCVGVLM